jgi:chemotaxis signal transduction protein
MYGVDVQLVQEVIRYQKMTDIPLAPESVVGLINLRGQIVTAIDMRKRLQLPARDGDRLPMNVVVTVAIHQSFGLKICRRASSRSLRIIAKGRVQIWETTGAISKNLAPKQKSSMRVQQIIHNSQLIAVLMPRKVVKQNRCEDQLPK